MEVLITVNRLRRRRRQTDTQVSQGERLAPGRSDPGLQNISRGVCNLVERAMGLGPPVLEQ